MGGFVGSIALQSAISPPTISHCRHGFHSKKRQSTWLPHSSAHTVALLSNPAVMFCFGALHFWLYAIWRKPSEFHVGL